MERAPPLLTRFNLFIWCSTFLLGSVCLLSLVPHLMDLRQELQLFTPGDFVPGWNIMVLTSKSFIFTALAMPFIGVVAIWSQRHTDIVKAKLLVGFALVMLSMVMFILATDPVGGHVACCMHTP